MAGSRPLTESQALTNDITRLYAGRLSERQIADWLGLAHSTVHRKLKAAGVVGRKRKVQKPARIVLLLERSALARIRKKAGHGKVNEWIRKVIDEALHGL